MAANGNEKRKELPLPDVDDYMMPWDRVAGADPDAISISDTRALIYFDLLFFANYSIGWMISYEVQPRFTWENNITRAFGVTNICVGVDSFPARLIASWIWSLAFPLYILSCYIAYRKENLEAMADEREGRANRTRCCCSRSCARKVRQGLLIASILMASTFVITYSIPPDRANLAIYHVSAFAVGLFGYALLKIYRLMNLWMDLQPRETKEETRCGLKSKYWSFLPVLPSDRPFKTLIYALSLLVQAAWFLIVILGLSVQLAQVDHDVFATVDSSVIPVPPATSGKDITYDQVQADITGNVLVFIAMFGPVIQWFTEPTHMKYQLQLKLNPKMAFNRAKLHDDRERSGRLSCPSRSKIFWGRQWAKIKACWPTCRKLRDQNRARHSCLVGWGTVFGLILGALVFWNATSLLFTMPAGLLPAAGDTRVATNVTWQPSPPFRGQPNNCLDINNSSRWCHGFEMAAQMGYYTGFRAAKTMADPANFLGPHIVMGTTMIGLLAAPLLGSGSVSSLKVYFFSVALLFSIHALILVAFEGKNLLPSRKMNGLPFNEIAAVILLLGSVAGLAVSKLKNLPGWLNPEKTVMTLWTVMAVVLLVAPVMQGFTVIAATLDFWATGVWSPSSDGDRPNPRSGHGPYAQLWPWLGPVFVVGFTCTVVAFYLRYLRRTRQRQMMAEHMAHMAADAKATASKCAASAAQELQKVEAAGNDADRLTAVGEAKQAAAAAKVAASLADSAATSAEDAATERRNIATAKAETQDTVAIQDAEEAAESDEAFAQAARKSAREADEAATAAEASATQAAEVASGRGAGEGAAEDVAHMPAANVPEVKDNAPAYSPTATPAPAASVAVELTTIQPQAKASE